MASIRVHPRSDGTIGHKVLYRHDRKQRSRTFDDPLAAERFRGLVEQVGPDKALEIIGAAERVAGEHTVTQWISHHIDHLTGIEEATRSRYRRYLELDIDPVMGALPLSAVTETTVAQFIQALTEAKASGKTIKNKHGFLSGALQGAVRAGHLVANPCEGRRLPRADAGKDNATFLTPEEFAVLRDAMTERWRPMTTFLVSTGMRYSEAAALTVGDIDPDAGTVRINKAWKYTSDNTRRLGPPKSRKGVRTINIPAQALTAAGDLDRPHDALVFATQSGDPISAQLYHNKAWRPALKKVEGQLGGKTPSPHDLRHTCASWMIAAGVPLPVIQAHLGHESITTTIGVYGHLDRRSAQAGAAAIGAALGGI
ncbi:tyrosine-type recombinase/integrase [Prescottella equi]|uniref:tyrosine-type recombinase/integrase n=1 Tax=Rhodococcus hoagii TaxID=43767 RepID=UPI0007CD8735|nr:site-specific integrase [Prescottella equi]